MARANRHFIPGGVWHMTHRCHKKEFLLKFAHDRTRFVMWLQEARKRFGVQILNYAVTSNQVHLLLKDRGDAGSIPLAIQLVAGRLGQEYNHRKRRKGAFWEDRYHATAIETGAHLRRCLVYIDLNMVRAGVVKHPGEWVHGGYHEIQGQRRRNTILSLDALDALAEAVEAGSREEPARAHREWIEEALSSDRRQREEFWSKSIAVGSAEFVRKTQLMLGMRGKGRDVVPVRDSFVLRESQQSYGVNSISENRPIALNNAYFWDDYFKISMT